MFPLFKASYFFCVLLLASGLTRGNNNILSPVVKDAEKTNPAFYQKINTHFSNDHLGFTYKSVDYSESAILQYIRRLIRKLYIKECNFQ